MRSVTPPLGCFSYISEASERHSFLLQGSVRSCIEESSDLLEDILKTFRRVVKNRVWIELEWYPLMNKDNDTRGIEAWPSMNDEVE